MAFCCHEPLASYQVPVAINQQPYRVGRSHCTTPRRASKKYSRPSGVTKTDQLSGRGPLQLSSSSPFVVALPLAIGMSIPPAPVPTSPPLSTFSSAPLPSQFTTDWCRLVCRLESLLSLDLLHALIEASALVASFPVRRSIPEAADVLVMLAPGDFLERTPRLAGRSGVNVQPDISSSRRAWSSTARLRSRREGYGRERSKVKFEASLGGCTVEISWRWRAVIGQRKFASVRS